jgi:hypothetical protein
MALCARRVLAASATAGLTSCSGAGRPGRDRGRVFILVGAILFLAGRRDAVGGRSSRRRQR